jgi:hypothetical protein
MRFLLSLVGAGVLAVVGLTAYLNLSGSDVVVVNAGRSAIQVRGVLPGGMDTLLAAAGVRNLPDQLQPGVPTVVRVPALSGQVEVGSGAIRLTLLGQSVAFSASCDSLSLDGATLIGRQTAFNLGGQPKHDLQIACH